MQAHKSYDGLPTEGIADTQIIMEAQKHDSNISTMFHSTNLFEPLTTKHEYS